MRIGPKKIAVGALLVAVALLMATLRPGLPQRTAEADLMAGSMVTLPSSLPGVIPAIAPASGPGNIAVANVACDPALPTCPLSAVTGSSSLNWEITRVFPDGDPAATFAASGGATLVCGDGAVCDVNLATPSLVVGTPIAVQVNGGGVNEVVRVTACDQSDACLSMNIIFTETIFAVEPTGAASGLAASFVSYHCSDVGAPTYAYPGGDLVLGTGDDEAETLGNVGELLLGFAAFDAPPFGSGSTWGQMFGCGADTTTTADDRVTFETDLSQFTVDDVAAAGAAVGAACDVGDSIDVADYPGVVSNTGAQCDLDAAYNGVVTTALRGTGTAGVASINVQQSGGIGPLRSINITETGAAATTEFNLEIQGPDLLGLNGDDYTMIVSDSEGRPVSGETVECSVDPTSAVLVFLAQTPTSDANGEAVFNLTPTGSAVLAGQEVTLSCFLDSNPDVAASKAISLSLAPETETLDLVAGCNFVSWTGADETPAADVAAGAAPADALAGLWAQQPAPDWKGYNPEFPEVSDMGAVNQLDVIAVCMSDTGTFTRPVL